MARPTNGTIGVAATLTSMTVGGLLIYSALKGKSFAQIFAGDTGETLDPAATIPDTGAVLFDDGSGTGGGTVGPDDKVTINGRTYLRGLSGDSNASPSDGSGLPGVQLGTTIIDGHPVANWIAREVLWARRNGWSGTVTSGVRSVAEQRQACINVCGNPNGCPGTCAKPGSSNHQGILYPAGAIDVGSEDQARQLILILRSYPGVSRLRWGALPNDRVHLSATGR